MNPYQSAFICASLILMTMLPDVAAQTRRQPVDLLVLGGTIVTMDYTRRVIDDGGIAVINGRIVAINVEEITNSDNYPNSERLLLAQPQPLKLLQAA